MIRKRLRIHALKCDRSADLRIELGLTANSLLFCLSPNPPAVTLGEGPDATELPGSTLASGRIRPDYLEMDPVYQSPLGVILLNHDWMSNERGKRTGFRMGLPSRDPSQTRDDRPEEICSAELV